ncbi:MAG TPA: hypothetical protein VEA59_02120 [Patescibacteria group bacterium]|nr:hypothetical protein [Patescibacteria group bacterium]
MKRIFLKVCTSFLLFGGVLLLLWLSKLAIHGIYLVFILLFGEGPKDFFGGILRLALFCGLIAMPMLRLSSHAGPLAALRQCWFYSFVFCLIPHLTMTILLADWTRHVHQNTEVMIWVAKRTEYLWQHWYIPSGWLLVGGWYGGEEPSTEMAYVWIPSLVVIFFYILYRRYKAKRRYKKQRSAQATTG